MTIQTLFFSVLRDAVGATDQSVTLPDGASGYDLFDALATEHPGLERYRSVVRLAVNRRYVSFETKLADGDEVVFIPPVSGG
ncbi:MAG: molybdopterin converting factor subunit 1 [Rubricoccaceae bacterium]